MYHLLAALADFLICWSNNRAADDKFIPVHKDSNRDVCFEDSSFLETDVFLPSEFEELLKSYKINM